MQQPLSRAQGALTRPLSVRRASHRVTRVALVIAIGALGVAGAAYMLGLRLNLTTSIPPGVYRVTRGPFERGTIVTACLPPAASAFAESRGFVPRGACHDGRAPIGKTIAAIAGDSVDVGPDGVRVNHRLLTNSRPLDRDSKGRILPRVMPGAYFVAHGQVWLVSSYSARSYDSRYFGPIADSLLISRIEPIIRFRY